MPFHTRNSICTTSLYHTRKKIPTTNYEGIVKLWFRIQTKCSGTGCFRRMNRRGDAGDGGEKSFFGNEKLFFENLLTNSSLCGIILSVNGTNRLLGICVMAAQQTLTLYVGVRISHPQPMKRAGKSSVHADFRLFVFFDDRFAPGALQRFFRGFLSSGCRQVCRAFYLMASYAFFYNLVIESFH